MIKFGIPRRSVSESFKGEKNPFYGKQHSEETRKKISEIRKGKNYGPFGENHPMYGKRHSEETRKKMSERIGEKSANWHGGVSFEPYPPKFNGALKRKIRERDKYVCQLCGAEGKNVHHIDYDKEKCEQSNLITLCRSCHSKTNTDREEWMAYFQGLLKSKPRTL